MKARQARSGHRGHMSVATRALEAGRRFLKKKTAKAVFFMGKEIAPGFEGMRRRQHMPPVPNARLARFFIGREIAPGFEGMRRRRHVSPVPTARLARFF